MTIPPVVPAGSPSDSPAGLPVAEGGMAGVTRAAQDAELRGELDLTALREADRTGLLAGIDRAVVFDIPLRTRFRGLTRRDGVLLHGPAGWGEVAPFWNYDAEACAPWLAAGLEQAVIGYDAVPRHRQMIPINVTVPQVSAQAAFELVSASGATTAKVKVAGLLTAGSGSPEGMAAREDARTLAADLERLEAVREALGHTGSIRIDVNGSWSLDQARTFLPLMDKAAGGLEYVEQPCAAVEDLAALRRDVPVRIAADESVRLAADPLAVARLEAADVAILKVAPLGGVRRALAVGAALGLPLVVSSALDTSVGISAGLTLAAALPILDHACGLGTASLFTADVAVPSLTARGGECALTAAHVSRTMLAGVAADEELTARWQVRLAHMLGALAARREREAADPASMQAGIAL